MQIKRMIEEYLQRKTYKKHENADYLNWLTYANAGMLDRGNLYCFEYAIKNLPSNNPIIEIGSFCGLSTNIISFYLEKFNKKNKLITSDKWIFEGGENENALLSGSNMLHKDYKEFVKETFKRNVSFFSKNKLPYTIEVFSDEFFELWQNKAVVKDVFGREITLGGPISFSFIDGNHSYEFAKRDFENSDRWLEKGGFILFDDSGDFSSWEVKKVIQEIKQSGRYEIVARNPNYLVKKIA